MECLRKCEADLERLFDELLPGDECNIDCYSKHVDHYDQSLLGVDYKVPKVCATMTLKHLKGETSNCQALDVCVGTGLASQEMVNAGFRGILDGLDGNEDMMHEARKRGIFRNLIKHIVKPATNLPLDDETYGVVVCSGAFDIGHLKPACLPEFFRIVKAGGIVCFNTPTIYQLNHVEGLNEIENILMDLENKQVCEKLEEMVLDSYDVSTHFKYYNGRASKFHCYLKK